jgi:hypothetical protein
VLALTDEALCHIALAATAVRPQERSSWLADVARRLERSAPSELAPSTLPTRLWRKRQRDGLLCLRIVIDEATLVVGLVERGLLDPLCADDKEAVAAAAARALARYCDGDASPHDARISDSLRASFLDAVRRNTRGPGLLSSNPTRARAPARRRR